MKKVGSKVPVVRKKEETHTKVATDTLRADLIVKEMIPKSRSEIRAIFQARLVKRNGVPIENAGELLAEGDKIEVTIEPGRKYREKTEKYKSRLFTVLFEDNYLIVVNKQAGFLTEPTENNDKVSLIASVNKYVSVKSGRSSGVSIVHRLDRDTSGVLVLAKHLNLAKSLKEQFSSRKPLRKYIAIVKGRPDKRTGTYKSFLATDEDLNQHSTNSKEGKLAITHYQVVKEYTDCCLVHVRLETGRRNQIRVHFAEDMHPVIGDPRYKTGLARHAHWEYRRIALHAAELGFTHPVTKKELHFQTPMPKEFEEFLGKLTPGSLRPKPKKQKASR